MDTIIRLHDVVLRHPGVQFTEPINWQIQTGEHWAVIGPNGSGKTVFIDTLTGKYALRSGTRDYPLLESIGCKISEAIIVAPACKRKRVFICKNAFVHVSLQMNLVHYMHNVLK